MIGGTGLYDLDGEPKPALRAYRFPFVTDRKSDKRILAWGARSEAGKVLIEEKSGNGWRKVHSEKVKAQDVFTAKLRVKGKAKLRASVGGDKSLVWTQKP